MEISKDDLRCDGRTMLDYHPLILETTLVSNASGSARLRLANSSTSGKWNLQIPTKILCFRWYNWFISTFFIDTTATLGLVCWHIDIADVIFPPVLMYQHWCRVYDKPWPLKLNSNQSFNFCQHSTASNTGVSIL